MDSNWTQFSPLPTTPVRIELRLVKLSLGYGVRGDAVSEKLRRRWWENRCLQSAVVTIFLLPTLVSPEIHPKVTIYAVKALEMISGQESWFTFGTDRAPVMQILVAFHFWIFGVSYGSLWIFLRLLAVANVILVYAIGSACFGPITGLVSACLFSGSIFFSKFLISLEIDPVLLLFINLGLLFYIWGKNRERFQWKIVGGLIWGGTYLIKQTAIFFLLFPFIIAIIRGEWKSREEKVQAFLVSGMTLIPAIVWNFAYSIFLKDDNATNIPKKALSVFVEMLGSPFEVINSFFGYLVGSYLPEFELSIFLIVGVFYITWRNLKRPSLGEQVLLAALLTSVPKIFAVSLIGLRIEQLLPVICYSYICLGKFLCDSGKWGWNGIAKVGDAWRRGNCKQTMILCIKSKQFYMAVGFLFLTGIQFWISERHLGASKDWYMVPPALRKGPLPSFVVLDKDPAMKWIRENIPQGDGITVFVDKGLFQRNLYFSTRGKIRIYYLGQYTGYKSADEYFSEIESGNRPLFLWWRILGESALGPARSNKRECFLAPEELQTIGWENQYFGCFCPFEYELIEQLKRNGILNVFMYGDFFSSAQKYFIESPYFVSVFEGMDYRGEKVTVFKARELAVWPTPFDVAKPYTKGRHSELAEMIDTIKKSSCYQQ